MSAHRWLHDEVSHHEKLWYSSRVSFTSLRNFLRVPLLLPLFAAFSLSACEGGGGDEEPANHTGVTGDGMAIEELLAQGKNLDGSSVHVTGVRVAFVDTYDETNSGRVGNVFLTDLNSSPKAFQGLLAYNPGFAPPSYRPVPGDVVDVSAAFQLYHLSFVDEIYVTPELVTGTLSLRFDSPKATLKPIVAVAPLADDASDEEKLNTFEGIPDLIDYDRGKPWISMLVTLKNVVVSRSISVDSSGNAEIVLAPPLGVSISAKAYPKITNGLFDLAGSHVDPQQGDVIKSITGFVLYSDRFEIAPRSVDDISL